MRTRWILAGTLLLAAPSRAEAPVTGSYAPEKGCAWTRLSDPELGIELVYQKCDFGYQTISMTTSPKDGRVYIVMRDTDNKGPDSREEAIRVFDKDAGETPEKAIQRIAFPALTAKQRKHCRVHKLTDGHAGPGRDAYELGPDKTLTREMNKSDGVPDPPCGDLGFAPDGQVYFEFHPTENPKRFVFVDFGQEEHPQFDEFSLKFLP